MTGPESWGDAFKKVGAGIADKFKESPEEIDQTAAARLRASVGELQELQVGGQTKNEGRIAELKKNTINIVNRVYRDKLPAAIKQVEQFQSDLEDQDLMLSTQVTILSKKIEQSTADGKDTSSDIFNLQQLNRHMLNVSELKREIKAAVDGNNSSSSESSEPFSRADTTGEVA